MSARRRHHVRQRIRRRRGPRAIRRRYGARAKQIARALLWLGLVGTVAAGGSILGHRAWVFFTTSDFFRLREVQISGVSPSIESEMRALIADQTANGLTLFTVSPRLLRARLSEHPRLDPGELSVSRRWPDSIHVEAAERRPVAVVAGSRLMLVDPEGWVIEQTPGAVAAADLPLLTGLDLSEIIYGQRIDDADARVLLDWLAAIRRTVPRLMDNLAELHIEPTGEVTAYLMGGTAIRLGDRLPEDQLPVILTFMREIESDLTELALLDLRMSDHLVYRRQGVMAGAPEMD